MFWNFSVLDCMHGLHATPLFPRALYLQRSFRARTIVIYIYVYMYVYMYLCIYTCIYVYAYVYIYICIYVSLFFRLSLSLSLCFSTCLSCLARQVTRFTASWSEKGESWTPLTEIGSAEAAPFGREGGKRPWFRRTAPSSSRDALTQRPSARAQTGAEAELCLRCGSEVLAGFLPLGIVQPPALRYLRIFPAEWCAPERHPKNWGRSRLS